MAALLEEKKKEIDKKRNTHTQRQREREREMNSLPGIGQREAGENKNLERQMEF